MAKCSFCGSVLAPGTGMIFVEADGKVLYFCRQKCEKNMLKLRRKPYDVRWSKLFKKAEK
ncbi:50S ribosomal protein L24e [Candidatus Woesearchaeota archaeon]|nr:50S ribosomal protein L24e [Candidatus Woesearchaeota archaeon]